MIKTTGRRIPRDSAIARDNSINMSGAIARVLAPHFPFVCTSSAPAYAYLAILCTFVSLFVFVCERVCCACARPLCVHALHLFARAFPVPARVLCLVFGRLVTRSITVSGYFPRM